MFFNKDKNTVVTIAKLTGKAHYSENGTGYTITFGFGENYNTCNITMSKEIKGADRAFLNSFSMTPMLLKEAFVAIEIGLDNHDNWKVLSIENASFSNSDELRTIEDSDVRFLYALSKDDNFNGGCNEDNAKEEDVEEEKVEEIEEKEEEDEIGEDDELIIVGRLDGSVWRYYDQYRMGLDFHGAEPMEDEKPYSSYLSFGDNMTTYDEFYIWPATEGLNELLKKGNNKDLVVVKGTLDITPYDRKIFKPSYVGLVPKDDKEYNRIITLEMAKAKQINKYNAEQRVFKNA